jgi:RNA polymerase sigma-70 factor (ECF subfamily)
VTRRPLLGLSAAGLAELRSALAVGAGGSIALTATLPRSQSHGDDSGVRDLVDRAKGGDGNAFGSLYDRYVDAVYRYVYYRVGSQPLAEDLVSETFLRALRHIGSFRWQGSDFGAWLTTIARNLITDHYKSSRYRLEVPTAELLDSTATVAPAAESVVLDREATGRLLEAVRRLPGDQQECVVLRFLQGLPVAETARIMGRGEGAIKALQYRATRALARLLDESGGA